MTDEKWQQISALIESKFTVEDHGEEELDPGYGEYYVFEVPNVGRIKLERVIRPKFIGSKLYASKRIGATSNEEKIYSENEEVSFLDAFIWNNDVNSWSKFDASNILG
ncbi:MAG: hypothetical protein WC752_02790 [Patescibacteria group bacterium]|jgi:hypothetical protein